MKFAGFPKFVCMSVMAGVLSLVLTGCGANSSMSLTQGNWSMTATPTAGGNGTFYIGGNLSQSGSSVSANMYVVGSQCFDSSAQVALSGTVSGTQLVLTSGSVQGQVVTITTKGTGGSTTSGTYTVAGGCDDGDTGNIAATLVPSISATWSGPIVSQGGPNVTLSFALTQAASASSNGTFAISGNGSFANSSCSNSATVTNAFIAGPYLLVNGTTDDGGDFSYSQVLLNNPSTPTSMKGTYQVFGGNCDGDLDNPTFTKQ
jgi:hypothetical protein